MTSLTPATALIEQPSKRSGCNETEALMHHVLSMLAELLPAQAIPNPPPAAPPELAAKTSTVIGLVKWGSLMAALIGLAAFGLLSLAAERGGMGSHSADMKERMGKIIGGLVIVMTSTAIVTFIAS